MTDAVDRVDHPRCTDQRVAPPRHRCRPGMRLLAGDGHLVPALPLGAGHHADRLACGFEDRPLLDMGLEIGGDRTAADRFGPGANCSACTSYPSREVVVGSSSAGRYCL